MPPRNSHASAGWFSPVGSAVPSPFGLRPHSASTAEIPQPKLHNVWYRNLRQAISIVRLSRISLGVTVAERAGRTLERTLGSIAAAGFTQPRVFADGTVSVPDGAPVTRRLPALGGWPNFWLALTELVAREPQADAYLLIQDDVVFCRDTARYVSHIDFPEDAGVISLFTPACYNGPFGWHPFPGGYGMAGAQALLFPQRRACEFLAHPWTVNHRRSAPKNEHYRGDGLHHIDGVVGEWRRLAGQQGYTHTPSLSQHIGESSVMYPGFRGKQDRRFADSFPGEQVEIGKVVSHFIQRLQQWTQAAGVANWALSGPLWTRIAADLKPGLRTLELGSGLSTQLFLDAGCDHTAVEHDAGWIDRLAGVFPDCTRVVQHAPLTGSPPWYNWSPQGERFDLILIDGPPGEIGRDGVLGVLPQLVHERTILVIDDVLRPDDRLLAAKIHELRGGPMQTSTSGHYGYTILTPLPSTSAAFRR